MAGCARGRTGDPRWGPRGDVQPPLKKLFGDGSGSGKGCQLNCKPVSVPTESEDHLPHAAHATTPLKF